MIEWLGSNGMNVDHIEMASILGRGIVNDIVLFSFAKPGHVIKN